MDKKYKLDIVPDNQLGNRLSKQQQLKLFLSLCDKLEKADEAINQLKALTDIVNSLDDRIKTQFTSFEIPENMVFSSEADYSQTLRRMSLDPTLNIIQILNKILGEK